MPFRRKRRFFKKRRGRRNRRFRKKRKGTGGSSRYSRKNDSLSYLAPTPRGQLTAAFPQTYFVKVPYKETAVFDGAADFAIMTYQPTSLVNISGSEDYQWKDKLLALYDRWVCTAFSYKVTMWNYDPTSVVIMYVLLWAEDAAPANNASIAFQKGVQECVMSAAIEGGRQMCTIRGYTTVKKLTGVNVVNEEEYWGLASTPPSIQPRMYIAAFNPSGPTPELLDVQFRLEVTGYFKCFSPNLQGGGPTLASVKGIPFGVPLKHNGTVPLGKDSAGKQWPKCFVEESKEEMLVVD